MIKLYENKSWTKISLWQMKDELNYFCVNILKFFEVFFSKILFLYFDVKTCMYVIK